MKRRLSYLLKRRVNRELQDPQGWDESKDRSEGVTMFWPSLHLTTIRELDHETPEFDPELLLEAAAGLESGKPLDHELALAAAAALRELAEPSKHPDITPLPVRALNLAVHVLAAKELDPRRSKVAAALKHVSQVWSIPELTVIDLIAKCRGDAARVLEEVIINRLAHIGFADRLAVIRAIDADMQWRATTSTITRPAPRARKSKGVSH